MEEKRLKNKTENTESALITIELAGICIGIRPLSEDFGKFCAGYMSEGEPEFVIEVTAGDIEEENERAIDYMGRSDTPALELEKLFVYREIAERIPKYNTFLMHAAAIRVDENAFLLAGPSGAGKTTHARLWKKVFQDRMYMINDDKPLIRVRDDEIRVFGSPWCGKERWQNNISAPLQAVIFVNQAEENSITKMEDGEAWGALMNQVYRSRDAANMQKTLNFLDRVISMADIYSLYCNRDTDAVMTAYEAIRSKAT